MPERDDNGDFVSRRELRLTLAPMRDDIKDIKEDVHEIRTAIGAGPRWLGGRATAVVDKLLPTALMLAALYLFGEKLMGGG